MTDDAIRKALKRWPDAISTLGDGRYKSAATVAMVALLDDLQDKFRPGGVPDCFEPDVKALHETAAPTPKINGYAVGVWHEWGGGKCPFCDPTTISMKMRLGTLCSIRPTDFRWKHKGQEDDIIAFYLVPPYPSDIEANP